MDLQGSALGLTINDIQTRFSDRPLSRRTAERLRDALARIVGDRLEEVSPGERPKRWRLRGSSLITAFDSPSLNELASIETAIHPT